MRARFHTPRTAAPWTADLDLADHSDAEDAESHPIQPRRATVFERVAGTVSRKGWQAGRFAPGDGVLLRRPQPDRNMPNPFRPMGRTGRRAAARQGLFQCRRWMNTAGHR